MKMRYIFIIITLIIIIFGMLYKTYNSTALVGTEAHIVSKDFENGQYWVIVKEQDDRNTTKIIIPPIVYELIKKEQEYYITYEFNKWRSPYLTHIELIER
jgi:uncharacterized membrane protein (DUF106 family)